VILGELVHLCASGFLSLKWGSKALSKKKLHWANLNRQGKLYSGYCNRERNQKAI